MYCDREQLDKVYGRLNIDKWADLNNTKDSNEIKARVDYMIEMAQAFVDGRLANSAYEVPFEEPPPTIVSHATALYAGVMLYDGRRVVQDELQDQTSAQQKEFESIINRILSDTLKLPLLRVSTQPIKVHQDLNDSAANGGAYDSAFTAPC